MNDKAENSQLLEDLSSLKDIDGIIKFTEVLIQTEQDKLKKEEQENTTLNDKLPSENDIRKLKSEASLDSLM
jgi:nitrate reductase NapAB chaperone NapD